MIDPLATRARASERTLAFVDGLTGQEVTWGQLQQSASKLAGRLRELGVTGGSRVALLEPPGRDLAVVLHACIRLQASLVPVSPRLPYPELARQLADCDPRLILTSAPGAAAAAHVSAEPGAQGRAYECWSFDNSIRALDQVSGTPITEAAVRDEQEVCTIYTSGSTGTPKGVRLTLGNHRASATGCAESLEGFDADDRWLMALAPNRIGGLAILIRSVLHGFAVVSIPRFAENEVIVALDRGTNLVSFVPAMLERLLRTAGADRLRAARAIMVGGAPADAATVQAWVRAGLAVCPTYGLTESCSQVATVPPGRAAELAGTVGLVHSQAFVDIEPEDDRPDVHAGQILIGGPVLCPGYVTQAENSQRFVERAGRRLFLTGDIGTLRDDGVLAVHGRVDFTIITGGEKVQPEEVEAVLTQHRGVMGAMVRGAPDPVYGEIVEAIVVGDVSPSELRRWCSARLAPYKVPRRVRCVESLPRTEDGKLDRNAQLD